MIWRPNDLITDVDHFVVLLTLAHEGLAAAVSTGHKSKVDGWFSERLPPLKEACRIIGRHRTSAVGRVVTTFDQYVQIAERLLTRTSAPNETGAALPQDQQQQDLKACYELLRAQVDEVLRAAHGARGAGAVAKWLITVVTSLVVATGTFEIQSCRRRQLEAEDQQNSKPLDESFECTAEDWSLGRPRLVAPKYACSAWRFRAWRAAPAYAISVSSTSSQVRLQRLDAQWLTPAGSDAIADDSAANPLTYYACGVSKGAELRMIVWAESPLRRETLVARAAIPSKEEGTPCP
jgi:hypothetical protein